MIIKIIPEENETIKEVEHKNVKEFFIFGNKKDEDGGLIDFHDWSGQYRYLQGSMHYFLEQLRNEHVDKKNTQELPKAIPPTLSHNIDTGGILKHIPIDKPNLKVLSNDDFEELPVDEEEVGTSPSETAEDDCEEVTKAEIDADKF